MEINREDFLQALNIVSLGLANKDIIEHTKDFMFEPGTIRTFNEETSLSVELLDSKIQGAIKSEDFIKIISKLDAETLNVEQNDSEVIFKTENTTVGVPINFNASLPFETVGELEGEWKKLDKNFCDSLAFANSACSTNMSNFIITCVHVNGKTLQATDRYRGAIAKLDKKLPLPELLISSIAVKEILRFKPILVCNGKGNWIHFKNHINSVLSCRISKEQFPDISNIFENDEKTKKIELPKNMREIFERLTIVSKEQVSADEKISISFNNGIMTLLAKPKTGSAWIKEKVKVDFKHNIEFTITPYLFKDILKKTSIMFVGKNKVRFETKHGLYVAALR